MTVEVTKPETTQPFPKTKLPSHQPMQKLVLTTYSNFDPSTKDTSASYFSQPPSSHMSDHILPTACQPHLLPNHQIPLLFKQYLKE